MGLTGESEEYLEIKGVELANARLKERFEPIRSKIVEEVVEELKGD